MPLPIPCPRHPLPPADPARARPRITRRASRGTRLHSRRPTARPQTSPVPSRPPSPPRPTLSQICVRDILCQQQYALPRPGSGRRVPRRPARCFPLALAGGRAEARRHDGRGRGRRRGEDGGAAAEAHDQEPRVRGEVPGQEAGGDGAEAHDQEWTVGARAAVPPPCPVAARLGPPVHLCPTSPCLPSRAPLTHLRCREPAMPHLAPTLALLRPTLGTRSTRIGTAPPASTTWTGSPNHPHQRHARDLRSRSALVISACTPLPTP
jgi:hypothetical protein